MDYLLSFDSKTPAVSREKVTNMIATSKNKIVGVLAYAREVSIRHRHTRKYAKHLVALAIKQMMHLQLDNSQNSYQKVKSNDWL